MIKSFADPDAETIYHRRTVDRLPPDIQPAILRLLRMLNNAVSPGDLRLVTGRPLGAQPGKRTMRIDDHWQLHYEWRDGDFWGVAIHGDHEES